VVEYVFSIFHATIVYASLNESGVGNNQWFVGNLTYLLNLQCSCIRQKLVRQNKQSEGMKQQQTDGSGFASFLKSKAQQ
jgi:hypothetical protein